MTEEGTLQGRIEAILFVAGQAVAVADLARALQVQKSELLSAVKALQDKYSFEQSGFDLRHFGDKLQLSTRALYAEDIVHMLQPVQKQSLSQAVMETLAVVAYRQPVTKAQIEQVRGVKCDYSVQSLMHKELICQVGRKDTLGRPILYGTTDNFLSHFGIASLQELPPLPQQSAEDNGEPREQLIP